MSNQIATNNNVEESKGFFGFIKEHVESVIAGAIGLVVGGTVASVAAKKHYERYAEKSIVEHTSTSEQATSESSEDVVVDEKKEEKVA